MNKTQIQAARAALETGSFRLTASGKGRQTALAKFLLPGNPGARLAQAGWTEEAFAYSLAEYATKLITAGHPVETVHGAFMALGATNSSAASQAAKALTFEADGLDLKPLLGDVWTECLGGAKPLASGLPGLD
jgi:hypothetical protein